jgi:hypothetical protein
VEHSRPRNSGVTSGISSQRRVSLSNRGSPRSAPITMTLLFRI